MALLLWFAKLLGGGFLVLTAATLAFNLLLHRAELPWQAGPDTLARALWRQLALYGLPVAVLALVLAWPLWRQGVGLLPRVTGAWLAVPVLVLLLLPGWWIFQFGIFKQFPHLAPYFRLRSRKGGR